MRQRTKVKNAVHSLLSKMNVENPFTDPFGKAGISFLSGLELPEECRFILDGYLEVLSRLNGVIEGVESRVKDAHRNSHEAKLLSTIPGVGPVLSLTIISEIGDISRFRTAKQLSSHSGLCPSTSQSGGRVRHGRITRQGSRWLRWALVEAAIHAVSHPGPLRDYYLKLRRKKGGKVARVAVARKLSTYVFWMLKEGKPFSEVLSRMACDLG